MSRKPRQPAYCFHKASGQARVRINGRDIYLGTYDSPESHERYDDLIKEWRIQNCSADRYTLTIDELSLMYLKHAQMHYRKNGRETSEVHCVRSTLRVLVAVAGTTRAREFGPRLLKLVREKMIADGLCRRTINANVSRIRRIFRWAVAEEFVPATVLTSLEAVRRKNFRRRNHAGRRLANAKTQQLTIIPLPFFQALIHKIWLYLWITCCQGKLAHPLGHSIDLMLSENIVGSVPPRFVYSRGRRSRNKSTRRLLVPLPMAQEQDYI